MRRFEQIILYAQVLQQELHRKIVVRLDPADPRGREEHYIGFLVAKETRDSLLVEKIQLVPRAHDWRRISLCDKRAHDCRANEPAVARNKTAAHRFVRHFTSA